MFGKRTLPSEVAKLKLECKRLRGSGLTLNAVGVKLGISRATVLYHLGKTPKKYKDREKWNAYTKKRRKDVRNGSLVVKKRGKWKPQEETSSRGILGSGSKDRVKGTDGRYYFWCPECLIKTSWTEYKRTRKCSFC